MSFISIQPHMCRFIRPFGAVVTAAFVLLFGTAAAQNSQTDLTGIKVDQPPAFAEPILAERYLVRPGDSLIVTFLDAQVPSRRFVVNVDGAIVDRVIGRVEAGGRRLSEVKEILGKLLAEAYRVESYDISISGPLRIAVSVSGEVGNPGVYGAYTSQRVSEVLASAGGLRGQASRRGIRLVSPADTLLVDLERAFVLGQSDANPFLAAGSQIHVPRRSFDVVSIQGEVMRPTELELVEEDTPELLVALAGGPTERADVGRMVIYRNGQPSAASETTLMPGDLLFVPVDSSIGEFVSVFGAIERPGRYAYEAGMSLYTLFSRAGGATDDAVSSRITVFRRITGMGTGFADGRRYPIEFRGDYNGDAKSFILHATDSVVVPNRLGYVRVTGLVRNPGYIPHKTDQPAQYYVEAAGGYLPTANQKLIGLTNRVSGLSSDVAPGVTARDGDVITVREKEGLQ